VGSVSGNQVFVAENGIARLKTVTAGRILGDKVEILNGFLMVKWLLPQVKSICRTVMQ
jgi:hypothetical protein